MKTTLCHHRPLGKTNLMRCCKVSDPIRTPVFIHDWTWRTQQLSSLFFRGSVFSTSHVKACYRTGPVQYGSPIRLRRFRDWVTSPPPLRFRACFANIRPGRRRCSPCDMPRNMVFHPAKPDHRGTGLRLWRPYGRRTATGGAA